MADETSESLTLSREDAAAKLEAIASELRRTEADIAVNVENKSISLTPAESVEYDIAVDEHSGMLRSKRESIRIDLQWAVDD
jgi:amphi-Trp domain-containing protein